MPSTKYAVFWPATGIAEGKTKNTDSSQLALKTIFFNALNCQFQTAPATNARLIRLPESSNRSLSTEAGATAVRPISGSATSNFGDGFLIQLNSECMTSS